MKPRADCTIVPAGNSVYHIQAIGSDLLLATVKRLPSGHYYRRWGVRRYGRELDRWVPRSTMEEAVDYAVAHLLKPDVPRETKE